jgi:FkbM family methyltransferase
LRRNATFVEVGAFDGESWSNTCSLADYGWIGLYIEPIHKYAQLCHRRHSKNKVHIAEYAVGSSEGTADIYIGGAFTTCRGGLPDLYNSIEWTGGAHIDKELIQVRQRKLDDILFENGIKPHF